MRTFAVPASRLFAKKIVVTLIIKDHQFQMDKENTVDSTVTMRVLLEKI